MKKIMNIIESEKKGNHKKQNLEEIKNKVNDLLE